MVVQDSDSPHQALQLLQAHHFDLAIIDMHMPGMDGGMLAATLRLQGHTLPLVLFTSLGRRDAGDGLFAATLAKPCTRASSSTPSSRCWHKAPGQVLCGMDDYIAKPIRVEELVQALQQAKAGGPA